MICIRPELVPVKTPAIRHYSHSPSISRAWAILKQAHWDQFHNPAVVWRYFETALLCWNTPASDFEKPLLVPKTSTEALNFWNQSAVYSTWRKISCAKEGNPKDDDHMAIFTEQLFKKGYKTLINTITAFMAKGPPNLESIPVKKVSLELFWYCDKLWIAIDEEGTKKRFCLQRFNDTGLPGGSDSYQFCKKIIEHAQDGSVFPRQIECNRPAHTLNRIKLPKVLKKLYFGPTCKNSVIYQGPQLLLDAKTATLLICELQEIHRSNGSPEFVQISIKS